MVAAIFSLFAVVMLVIILHLYARYLTQRRERRRLAFFRALRTQTAPFDASSNIDQPPKQGLEPLVIASLPSFSYKVTTQHDPDDYLECSVCLGTIIEDAVVRILPNCKHMFHVECIDMWLGSHTTCPVCRTTAEPQVQLENTIVQPTAPPIGPNISRGAEGGSGSGSGSWLGSFSRMVSGERSSRRVQSCGDEVSPGDLERQ
ncbi:hypothetical protein SLEP1_g7954 [Rubroshorea leprosula]|uniref:RING-type E3 ubiquitin transferase n=1 Tax=Rubroshorea leprosula TaxID=152421 RepID=A0AAV5I819_9ROSI|nr:hypothetical protein SLEP1_g7954 [Rubroshorea leprosula]